MTNIIDALAASQRFLHLLCASTHRIGNVPSGIGNITQPFVVGRFDPPGAAALLRYLSSTVLM
jgi:hypothetical protein